jgi:hypothetical protein
MKKVVLTTLALFIFMGGIVEAQSECDQAYIKAMQANNPTERAKFLKEFLGKCGGKGSQYENFANAYLCTLIYPGKTEQEITSAGEKALSLGGIDDNLKCQVLISLSAVYTKGAQTLDKSKAYANQVIQTATAAKAKEADPGAAATWNTIIGTAHLVLAQAYENSKDAKGAVDSYINSYNILKQPAILAELKKFGKRLYETKDYANAEKIFRFTSQVNAKDSESATLVAQILYKMGKTQEALTMFKEIHAKQKSGEMAYNIGIILAREAKTNPVLAQDAIRYLLDAALLYPAQSKKSMEMAEYLYFSSDKEWNDRVKKIQESSKLIEEWTTEFNKKFESKSEEELTPDEKREFRKKKENIEKEQKIIADLQAKQKASMDGFNKLLAEAKQRLGVK